MKVIATDNFDRSGEMSGRDERVVCTTVDEMAAEMIRVALNAQYGSASGPWYYTIVPDDYVLRRFEP